METRRPLEGIRVLELAQVVAGPFCGTLMAEFGAEVIKTEMPGKGDDLRRLGPSEEGVSYWFAVDNRNKKLMTLDLRTPKGQEIVRRLVPRIDVVLENFRPGVLEKWGLGWETLRALNPRLVMARITAFGQTGPLRQGPGYAAIGSAFGGTWYVSGHADRPPARPTPVYPDYLTGLFTAFGVMAALRHRDATGEGQWIDAALYESAFRIMEFTTTFYGRQGVVRERGGLQHAGWPGGAFETQDHRWIVFTAPAQHLFERLCVMLGEPELPRDPRFASATERPKHIDVVLEMAQRWFAARSFDKAMDELHAHDIPHSPVMSMADIFADPHYRAREMIVDVPPDIGALPQPGVTPKLSLTPGRVTHAGAALGHRTANRVVDILELLAASPDGLALRDVSAELEAPKSSLLPLLRALTARGYLAQGRAGEYRLGRSAVDLGAAVPTANALMEAARPAVVDLMRRTGETVFLGTLSSDHTSIVFVDKVDSDHIIRYAGGVGDRRPLHATAIGKAILAFLPARERDGILKSLSLSRHTDRTVTSLPALRASLEDVRKTGVCVTIEELVPGASGIAAPIFERPGRLAAGAV